MERWLLIDDNKRWQDVLNTWGGTPQSLHPGVEFFIAKTFSEGKRALAGGNWDRVYVDQDLNGRGDETGYDILDLIKDNKVQKPKDMMPCSGHPGHYMAMHKMIEQMYSRLDKDIKLERYK